MNKPTTLAEYNAIGSYIQVAEQYNMGKTEAWALKRQLEYAEKEAKRKETKWVK